MFPLHGSKKPWATQEQGCIENIVTFEMIIDFWQKFMKQEVKPRAIWWLLVGRQSFITQLFSFYIHGQY